MQTPFDKPVMSTPSAEGNGHVYIGGLDLKDGRPETPGQGGVPVQPTNDDYSETPPGPRDITSFMANQTFHSGKG